MIRNHEDSESPFYACHGCGISTTNPHRWCNACNKEPSLTQRMYMHAKSERMERGE